MSISNGKEMQYLFIFKASKVRFKKLFLVFDSALEMD